MLLINFDLLNVDAKKYLPGFRTINIYFMKGLVSGDRNALSVDKVKHLCEPQYESLLIQKVLQFEAESEGVARYFPEDRDIPSLPIQISLALLRFMNFALSIIFLDFSGNKHMLHSNRGTLGKLHL